jgi:hypothetical protein
MLGLLMCTSFSYAMQIKDTSNDDVPTMICPVAQLTDAQRTFLKHYHERKKDPVVDASDGYWVTSKKISIFTVVTRVEQQAKL